MYIQYWLEKAIRENKTIKVTNSGGKTCYISPHSRIKEYIEYLMDDTWEWVKEKHRVVASVYINVTVHEDRKIFTVGFDDVNAVPSSARIYAEWEE